MAAGHGWLRRMRDAAETALFALAIAPFLVVPADWTIRAFGWIGRVIVPLTPAARPVAENLALARPALAPQARRIAAAVGDNFGRVLAEYIRMPDVAARRDRRRVAGLRHLEAARAEGRGVVLVSAHFGNWEAARLAARDAGVECALIYRAFNNAWFNRLALMRIRRAGDPVFFKGKTGSRQMLAHLRRGGALLVLLDQRAAGGPLLPFLGQPAETFTAVAAMAARIGAPMVPVSARRDATGLGFDVVFERPIPPGDAAAMSRAINDRIAAWIDGAPGQWFWLHRRFRIRRPENRRDEIAEARAMCVESAAAPAPVSARL